MDKKGIEEIQKLYLEELMKLEERHVNDVKEEMKKIYEEYVNGLKRITKEFMREHKLKEFGLEHIEFENPEDADKEEDIEEDWEGWILCLQQEVKEAHNDRYDIDHEETMISVSYFHGDYFVYYRGEDKFEIQLSVTVESALASLFKRIKELKIEVK